MIPALPPWTCFFRMLIEFLGETFLSAQAHELVKDMLETVEVEGDYHCKLIKPESRIELKPLIKTNHKGNKEEVKRKISSFGAFLINTPGPSV